MKFSEKLKKLRADSDISQEELAEKVHVSRVAVSKWETGRGYPNIDSLQLIAKVFNTTIDDLLSSSEFIDIAKEEKNKFSGVLNLLSFLLFVLPIFRSVLPNGDIVSTWIFSVNYSSVVSFILDFSCIVISVFIGFYRVINKRETKTKIRGVESDNKFTAIILYRLGFSWPLPDSAYLERALEKLLLLDYFEIDDE